MKNDQVYCNQCGTVNECQFHYCLTCGNPIGETLYRVKEPKAELKVEGKKYPGKMKIKFLSSAADLNELSGLF